MVVIITLKSPRPRAVKSTATRMNMNREATVWQNSAQNGPAYGVPASIDETGVPERWATHRFSRGVDAEDAAAELESRGINEVVRKKGGDEMVSIRKNGTRPRSRASKGAART